MAMLLNTKQMPADPIEKIVWLDGVNEQVRRELDDLYRVAYFEARLQRRFGDAVKIGRTSRKRALAFTRQHNERLGRTVRWQDGLDPTSTAYTG